MEGAMLFRVFWLAWRCGILRRVCMRRTRFPVRRREWNDWYTSGAESQTTGWKRSVSFRRRRLSQPSCLGISHDSACYTSPVFRFWCSRDVCLVCEAFVAFCPGFFSRLVQQKYERAKLPQPAPQRTRAASLSVRRKEAWASILLTPLRSIALNPPCFARGCSSMA
eukprot:scaffold143_cov260-Pinguiococcus_pyrenoidosus.AAC.60